MRSRQCPAALRTVGQSRGESKGCDGVMHIYLHASSSSTLSNPGRSTIAFWPNVTPRNASSQRYAFNVRSGSSPCGTPVAWSVVVMTQRVQGFTIRSRICSLSSAPIASSAYGAAAVQQHVRPEAVDRQRRRQARIQVIERCARQHQHRVAVGKCTGASESLRPRGVRGSRTGIVETHESYVASQVLAEPARGSMSLVAGQHAITPDGDFGRNAIARSLQRHGQLRQSGRGELEVVLDQCRADQGQARLFTLREEAAVGRHHHPLAVVLQPAWRQPRLRDGNAATRLDGVDVERGDRDHAPQDTGTAIGFMSWIATTGPGAGRGVPWRQLASGNGAGRPTW